MRRIRSLTVLALTLALGGSLVAETRRTTVPHRYLPRSLDNHLVQVSNPNDGLTWSAWAYRNGAEFDVALSYLREDGVWSEPLLIGRRDGRDQTQPALTLDHDGNVFLAFTDSGRVMLSTLKAGARGWSAPLMLTGHEARAHTPAMRVVRDQLVIAYRIGSQVQIVSLDLPGPGRTSEGIVDESDPVLDHPPDEKGNDRDEWDYVDDGRFNFPSYPTNDTPVIPMPKSSQP